MIIFLFPNSWSSSFSGVHYSNHGEHPEGHAMFLFLINFPEQRSWWAVTLAGEQDRLESRGITLTEVCDCSFLAKSAPVQYGVSWECKKKKGSCFNKNNLKSSGGYVEDTCGLKGLWITSVNNPCGFTLHLPPPVSINQDKKRGGQTQHMNNS